MTSFAWMRVLESAPHRYDRGIRMLSGGRIDEVYEDIAERAAAPGRRVLDLGCGTGGVSLACASRGARVTAIDRNAEMLEVARAKLAPDAGLPVGGEVDWIELGMAEVEDRFPEESFDAVVSCLMFSELSGDEQRYALEMARSRLVPGGRLVVGDEVLPRAGLRRLGYRLRKLPRLVLTYLWTQTTTRPVRDLCRRVREAGFQDVHETRLWGDSFAIVSALRGDPGP